MLADRPEPRAYDLSSIRDVLCGAAPLSQDLRKRFNQRYGVAIREGWGMTEVVCGGIQTPISLVRKGYVNLIIHF
jgi:4-coumarate--CoA ligase